MPAGHRILPHTADVALEARAPDQESCVTEAVRALVETFADVRTAIPRQTVTVRFDEADGEELLVRVLEEVIYQEEVHGWVPVDVSVRDRADRFPRRSPGTSSGSAGPRTACGAATSSSIFEGKAASRRLTWQDGPAPAPT